MENIIRRLARRLALLGSLFCLVAVMTSLIAAYRYPTVSEQARQDELDFWNRTKPLTLKDRSALLNYTHRTGIAPRLLPPWEYDRDMCAAVVVKAVSFFTGVKFVLSSAWTFRTHRINDDSVSNDRKLTTVWDATEQFDENGELPPGVRAKLVAEVLTYPFDPQKVYVLGPLWSNTKHWDKIKAAGKDINSHLVFVTRGMAYHLIHRDDAETDPLHFEPLAEVFADGTMQPVWLAEVHEKSYVRKGEKELSWDPLRLPVVDRELPFTQNVIPYSVLRQVIGFPSKPWFAPSSTWPWFAQADSGFKKTLLHALRDTYDFYPRIKENANDQASR